METTNCSKVGLQEALQTLARYYLEKCQAPFSPEALKETTAAGNKALLAARSVPVAAQAINRTRVQQQGEHLAKVCMRRAAKLAVQGKLSPESRKAANARKKRKARKASGWPRSS